MNANPQRENGHIDIANEIAEQLCKINLRPYEWRTIWAIFRKTYGWHKKEDKISVSQFQLLTGLDRRHQHKALKTLTERNIITKNKDSYIVTYGFQKDYTKWQGYKPNPKPLPKSAIVSPTQTIAQIGNRVLLKQATEALLKQAPTKETKETIQKKETPPTYIQEIIEAYKQIKGYSTQPDWDKYHYKRHSAPAKRLYEAAGQDWQEAMKWVSQQGYCDWTLETVVKKLPEYIKSKGKSPLGAAGRILKRGEWS